MGLDTTHGCWSGPYSAFARWREHVQEAAGWHLELRPAEAGWPPYQWPREVNDAALNDANYLGDWDRMPEDPLVVLVAHSDCSGLIPVPFLIPLAERLEDIAARMDPSIGPVKNEATARANYDGSRAATLRFAKGLREAAAVGEAVEFH